MSYIKTLSLHSLHPSTVHALKLTLLPRMTVAINRPANKIPASTFVSTNSLHSAQMPLTFLSKLSNRQNLTTVMTMMNTIRAMKLMMALKNQFIRMKIADPIMANMAL